MITDWKTKTERHMTSRQRRNIRSWDGEGWMHRAVSKAADADRSRRRESKQKLKWKLSAQRLWFHVSAMWFLRSDSLNQILRDLSSYKSVTVSSKKTGRNAGSSRSLLQIACFVWARAHDYYIKTEIHWFHLQIFGIFFTSRASGAALGVAMLNNCLMD